MRNAIGAIREYRDGTVPQPFFVALNDSRSYNQVRDAVLLQGGTVVRLSDFCRETNAEPDFDALLTTLKSENKFVVLIGLGEYLALAGKTKTEFELSRVKEIMLSKTKVVVLLRGCLDVLEHFCDDPRFAERQVYLPDRATIEESFTVTIVSPELGLDGTEWLKAALRVLEDGGQSICIKTYIEFPEATVPVHRIRSAYDAVLATVPDWQVPPECGNDEQWKMFCTDLLKHKNADVVFKQYGLLTFKPGAKYDQWLFFIEKKTLIANGITVPSYLAFVANETARFDDFERKIIFSLLDFQPNSPHFDTFYEERKALLINFSDADMAGYVAETKIKGESRLHYLTDNTAIEQKAVIECMDKLNEIPFDTVKRKYSALAEYLHDFQFERSELTDYFTRYKRQKVLNRLEEAFLKSVHENARTRTYNLLPTRDAVIDQLDKTSSSLYFVDALGVEFLGFIQSRCVALGLHLTVKLTRANLPSLTRLNRSFFDDWVGRKIAVKGLDKVKHGGDEGFDFQQIKLPIHLVKELQIINSVLEQVKAELASGESRKAVIASDHGASRLVVVNGQELQYEVDSKGTHSGRCCAVCDLQGLQSATVENNYLVLADYGRFKGGRAANVEVHGGASWEEVMVPVIELTLLNKKVTVTLVNNVITANFRTKAEITLFSVDNLSNLSVAIRGTYYIASKLDENHHKVLMDDIKRSGKYTGDVFENSNWIGCVTFSVTTGTGLQNDLL